MVSVRPQYRMAANLVPADMQSVMEAMSALVALVTAITA